MSDMTFQRARSAEQREIRRRAILDTAAAMLVEMPVAEVSLNELSRRVGLAKSNVLRYFESREAILLELLDRAVKEWLDELPGHLDTAVRPDASARERGDQLAAVVAGSLAKRAVLCDLLSAQAGVLEHNVSVAVAARYKRATLDNITATSELVRRHLPEVGDEAFLLCGGIFVLVGAMWPYSRPSSSMLAAFEADPALAVLRLDFPATAEYALATFVAGTIARTASSADVD
ncbi:AcrR family transcriptional regulator [Streptomyces pseudovenezuelae]|uniref:AcrR family transcriptional regulator n=2 Tax=Streptomyces pseudovenezuelae TaxID=67350 RepID=A0ABT6L8W1_9ACTN|nr:AcrR family transcriptional regulator [Streptomyces pseudovenezuelae]